MNDPGFICRQRSHGIVEPVVALNVGLLLALLGVSGYTYLDAPEQDMNPRKWAAIAFLVPMFGFFAYIFECDDQADDSDDAEEMFVDGAFKTHNSRDDDVSWVSSPNAEETDGDTENREER